MDLPAEHYQKNSSLQFGLAQNALEYLNLQENISLLDVGCGDGKITALMKERIKKGRVVGIDASPNMIQLAKKEFPFLEFICIEAENMHFEDKFEKVTCFSCLHWIQNPRKALQNMAQLLNPQGEILILIYLKSKYSECLEKALEDFPDYAPLSAFKRTLFLKDYTVILESLNLKIVTCQENDLIAFYPHKEALKNYIKGWLLSYVPLPEMFQDVYLERVAEISTIYADSHRGFHIPYKTGIIKAKKG